MSRSSRRRRAPHACPQLEALEGRSLLTLAAAPAADLLADPARNILVRFRDATSPAASPAGLAQSRDRAATLSAIGAGVGYQYASGVELLRLAPGVSRDQAIARLMARSDVLYAEPDSVHQASWIPNDTNFASQWGLNQANDVDINAPEAWDRTTGSPTIVAVTDTGIDLTHPDLYLAVALKPSQIPTTIHGLPRSGIADTNGDGQIDFYDLNSLKADGVTVVRNAQGLPVNAAYTVDANGNGRIDGADLLADPQWATPGSDLIGWNYVANTNNPQDDHGHGTHVSGTIAARTNNGLGVAGVNPNARILPLKFLAADGSGSDSAAIAAIEYAANYGARVINASWGDSQSDPALADAIRYAGTKGSVFVAAAGNDSQNLDVTNSYPGGYHLSNMVTVAAVASDGSLAGFSSYSPNLVDLGAPGVSILSTTLGGGYGSMSGTSMAAPHVTGVTSLVAGLRPDLSADQLAALIRSSTKPLASLVGKTVSGGMSDASKAVRTAAGDPPPSSNQASAQFVGTDTTTQGNWQTAYGADGSNVIGNAQTLPAYATLAAGNKGDWTWAASTTDVRGLSKPASPTDRLAACWYGSTITIDANLTDGQTHPVSLYLLDWDRQGRSQRVDVVDAATGSVLDSRTLSSFTGGTYLTWNLKGQVQFRVTRLGGPNAVVSGVFFGGPLNSGSSTPPPNNPPPTTPPAGTASFLGSDATTQGSWQGAYGNQGYQIVNGATALPGYATVNPTGQSAWTWAASTSDVRALARPGAPATDRLAATWFATGKFDVPVTINDGQAHKVSLYVLDYDRNGRNQKIEVLDSATGAVLDTRTVSNFSGGLYLSYRVTGNVTIRLTNVGSSNAVLSGVFFDASA